MSFFGNNLIVGSYDTEMSHAGITEINLDDIYNPIILSQCAIPNFYPTYLLFVGNYLYVDDDERIFTRGASFSLSGVPAGAQREIIRFNSEQKMPTATWSETQSASILKSNRLSSLSSVSPINWL